MRQFQSNSGMERRPANQTSRFSVGSIELPGSDQPDFNAFFRHVPGMFIATHPDFTIAAASDDMLRKTFTWREQIVGRSIFEVFPASPSAEAPRGASKLEGSMREVLASGVASSVRIVRYDIQDRLTGDGGWIEKYWTVLSRPVIDRRSREVLYVLIEAQDVTRVVHLALWLERRDAQPLARDIQRTLQRLQQDLMSQPAQNDRARARIAEEMKLTGATPQMLLGELEALLHSPENRLYACAGEWVTEAGVYVSYHRRGCVSAPRVRYFAEGMQFPSCERCGNDVLYRISRALSS